MREKITQRTRSFFSFLFMFFNSYTWYSTPPRRRRWYTSFISDFEFTRNMCRISNNKLICFDPL